MTFLAPCVCPSQRLAIVAVCVLQTAPFPGIILGDSNPFLSQFGFHIKIACWSSSSLTQVCLSFIPKVCLKVSPCPTLAPGPLGLEGVGQLEVAHQIRHQGIQLLRAARLPGGHLFGGRLVGHLLRPTWGAGEMSCPQTLGKWQSEQVEPPKIWSLTYMFVGENDWFFGWEWIMVCRSVCFWETNPFKCKQPCVNLSHTLYHTYYVHM